MLQLLPTKALDGNTLADGDAVALAPRVIVDTVSALVEGTPVPEHVVFTLGVHARAFDTDMSSISIVATHLSITTIVIACNWRRLGRLPGSAVPRPGFGFDEDPQGVPSSAPADGVHHNAPAARLDPVASFLSEGPLTGDGASADFFSRAAIPGLPGMEPRGDPLERLPAANRGLGARCLEFVRAPQRGAAALHAEEERWVGLSRPNAVAFLDESPGHFSIVGARTPFKSPARGNSGATAPGPTKLAPPLPILAVPKVTLPSSGFRCVPGRCQSGKVARGRRKLRQAEADGLGNQREAGAVVLQLGLCLGAGLRVQLDSPFGCLIRPGISPYFPFIVGINGSVGVSVGFDPLEGADPPQALGVGGSQQHRSPMLPPGVRRLRRFGQVRAQDPEAIRVQVRLLLKLADGQQQRPVLGRLRRLGDCSGDCHHDLPDDLSSGVDLNGGASCSGDPPHRGGGAGAVDKYLPSHGAQTTIPLILLAMIKVANVALDALGEGWGGPKVRWMREQTCAEESAVWSRPDGLLHEPTGQAGLSHRRGGGAEVHPVVHRVTRLST